MKYFRLEIHRVRGPTEDLQVSSGELTDGKDKSFQCKEWCIEAVAEGDHELKSYYAGRR